MIKPQGCVGCPLYGNGDGYTPDDVNEQHKVVLVQLQVDSFEASSGRPFSGFKSYNTDKYLRLAGLQRGVNVGFSSLIRCSGKHDSKVLSAAIEHCKQYTSFADDQILVAIGNTVWETLTNVGSLAQWRGFYTEE